MRWPLIDDPCTHDWETTRDDTDWKVQRCTRCRQVLSLDKHTTLLLQREPPPELSHLAVEIITAMRARLALYTLKRASQDEIRRSPPSRQYLFTVPFAESQITPLRLGLVADALVEKIIHESLTAIVGTIDPAAVPPCPYPWFTVYDSVSNIGLSIVKEPHELYSVSILGRTA